MATSNSTYALPQVPASLFGIVLGLAGLGNDWRVAKLVWPVPAVVGEVIHAVALVAWLVITSLYVAKWILARTNAVNEAEHPVLCCFIGLAGVATMLVAQGVLPYSRPVALALFSSGSIFTVAFGLWRTGILWRGGRDPAATTPVLYLPMVAGGFVTGIVAVALGWTEFAQLAFGAAFFTWLAIESVLLHRLYTAPALPPALRPTLGIQLAPPSVGASCYLAINSGQADLFVHMLIGYALIQALLLLRMSGWIAEQPFSAAYWAFTFGATALAGAVIRLAKSSPDSLFGYLAPVLFVGANLLVLTIFVRTLRLLLMGKLIPAPAPTPKST